MTIKHFQVATIMALAIFVTSQTSVDINDADDAEEDDTVMMSSPAEFLIMGLAFIELKDLNFLDVADANMDGKTSLAEAADLLNAMFFKVTQEDLILFDADQDGFLTKEEVKSFDVKKVMEIMDPGTNLRPRVEKVFDFFYRYGVDMYGFSKTVFGIKPMETILIEGRFDTEMVYGLIYFGVAYHFIDQSMIRGQLAVSGVMRMIFAKEEVSKLFSKTDNDTLSSESVVKFFRLMFIKFNKRDFPDRISASDIRHAEVTRRNFVWPMADANGMFPMDQVKKFWNFYGFLVLDFYMTNQTLGFEIDGADLDQDGFLNANELHVWLGESDKMLIDEYYVNVVMAGARHFLNRVANLFEAYLNGKNVKLEV